MNSAIWNTPPACPEVTDDVEQSRCEAGDCCLGWSPLIGGRLAVRPMPGAHSSMIKLPLISIPAEAVQRRLNATTSGTG
ncbi:MAG: hypothetical protein OER43_10030 [Gammaproteobacteria bacterium]|nr:hypothetical protein [Gammaproteobacteria bacterium]